MYVFLGHETATLEEARRLVEQQLAISLREITNSHWGKHYLWLSSSDDEDFSVDIKNAKITDYETGITEYSETSYRGFVTIISATAPAHITKLMELADEPKAWKVIDCQR
jgi:hypothetical protein